ncbi:MAG TPA: hypothetical protein VEG35_01315 [Burkholderiales bacterium]|nr:hypothetical protein [Burkholderiales bacterium]
MIATETARTAVLVLLALSVFWVIILIVKNDTTTIIRAIITTVVLGVVFFYLNQTKLQTLSFKSIKNDLFPPKPLHFLYEKRESFSGDQLRTVYSFAEPGPEFVLSMEEGGKSLAVTDIDPLNRVLAYLGLPPVKKGTPELSTITGSTLDANRYRWDDYELGVLLIERGICRNIDSASTYPCIDTITILRR